MLTSSSNKQQENMSLGRSPCDSRAPETTFSLLFQVRKVVVVIFRDFISWKIIIKNSCGWIVILFIVVIIGAHAKAVAWTKEDSMGNHHYQHAIIIVIIVFPIFSVGTHALTVALARRSNFHFWLLMSVCSLMKVKVIMIICVSSCIMI